ncbi:MAG: DUF1707 domain-containing protein [Streptosporangiaceae bacterium]|nr:DUF1707 domain-containing protein [Streptosporangiaceae bacterium]
MRAPGNTERPRGGLSDARAPGALPAAARGPLRASDADREQVIDSLKAAFVHGRLAKDEFDVRVGRTFASRTYADLAAVTADLPAQPVPARRPVTSARSRPGKARPPISNAVKVPVCVSIAAVTLVASYLAGSKAIFMLFAVCYFMALQIAGVQALTSWYDRRSGGKLPPPPPPRPRAEGQGPVSSVRPAPG